MSELDNVDFNNEYTFRSIVRNAIGETGYYSDYPRKDDKYMAVKKVMNLLKEAYDKGRKDGAKAESIRVIRETCNGFIETWEKNSLNEGKT